MSYGKIWHNLTDDDVFGSFALIPYLANVEYNDREVVFGFLDGEGRSRDSVDRTASSKF
jgi:hypothetical protein